MKTDRELLEELLSLFYEVPYSGDLEWSFVEGVTVGEKLGNETLEQLKKIKRV